MAKISYIVYCNNADLNFGKSSSKRMIIDNPMPEISLPYLPTAYSLTLAIGLADISNDFQNDAEHNLKISCEMGEGKVIFESSDLTLKIPKEQAEKKISGMQLSVEMKNITFDALGILKTSVSYDGEIIGVHEIPVTKN